MALKGLSSQRHLSRERGGRLFIIPDGRALSEQSR